VLHCDIYTPIHGHGLWRKKITSQSSSSELLL